MKIPLNEKTEILVKEIEGLNDSIQKDQNEIRQILNNKIKSRAYELFDLYDHINELEFKYFYKITVFGLLTSYINRYN